MTGTTPEDSGEGGCCGWTRAVSTLRQSWEAAIAARERIVVEDVNAWTRTEGKRHRLSVGQGRRTMLDSSGFPIVCDEAHSSPDSTDVAKQFLRHVWLEQRRKIRGKWERRLPIRTRDLSALDLAHPIHFAGVRELPEAAAVDIEAAYYSLYRRLPLDLTYEPGRSFGLGRFWFVGADEMASDKAGRNIALGLTRARAFTVLERGQPVRQSPWANRYLSPGLWAFICDVLHAIAAEAIARGAVHYHTDGAILPASEAEGFREWLGETWGLGSTVSYGHAYIAGVGAWQIGDRRTKTYRDRPRRPISNVRTELPPVEWLARNLTWAQEVAPLA